MADNFKKELNDNVDGIRWSIKRDTIERFITLLKCNMIKKSQIGIRSGKMSREDIYNNLESFRMDLLENVLLEEANELENDITDVLDWLLEEVYKTRIFSGIDIEYVDDRKYLSFSWSA